MHPLSRTEPGDGHSHENTALLLLQCRCNMLLRATFTVASCASAVLTLTSMHSPGSLETALEGTFKHCIEHPWPGADGLLTRNELHFSFWPTAPLESSSASRLTQSGRYHLPWSLFLGRLLSFLGHCSFNDMMLCGLHFGCCHRPRAMLPHFEALHNEPPALDCLHLD